MTEVIRIIKLNTMFYVRKSSIIIPDILTFNLICSLILLFYSILFVLKMNPFDDNELEISSRISIYTFHNVVISILFTFFLAFIVSDLNYLLDYGFVQDSCERALIRSRGNKIDAFNMLVHDLYEIPRHEHSSTDLSSLWISPVTIRIGSWLPNFVDSESGEKLTKYVVHISLRRYDSRRWTVAKRFNDFFSFRTAMDKLFQTYYHRPLSDFIVAEFPVDRFRTWVLGTKDLDRHNRMIILDAWLRELVTIPETMLNPETKNLIENFLGFHDSTTIFSGVNLSTPVITPEIGPVTSNPFDSSPSSSNSSSAVNSSPLFASNSSKFRRRQSAPGNITSVSATCSIDSQNRIQSQSSRGNNTTTNSNSNSSSSSSSANSNHGNVSSNDSFPLSDCGTVVTASPLENSANTRRYHQAKADNPVEVSVHSPYASDNDHSSSSCSTNPFDE